MPIRQLPMAEDTNSTPPVEEAVPEPETIQTARQIIAKLGEFVEAGNVEALSVYVEHRDGSYRTMQANGPSRHEDAGRILEMAIVRLGFVDGETVRRMIEEAL